MRAEAKKKERKHFAKTGQPNCHVQMCLYLDLGSRWGYTTARARALIKIILDNYCNRIGTYLFVTFEYGTLERIRAGIACYVAEYFEIAAIVGHVKYSIDGMIEQLDFLGVIGPVLFLWKCQNKMSVCVYAA